jgi:hypothetical protein
MALRARLAGLAAAAAALGWLGLGRASDERNIRALAAHIGCSKDEARRLYRLSRRVGYGAAYMKVFPGRAIQHVSPYPTDFSAGREKGPDD